MLKTKLVIKALILNNRVLQMLFNVRLVVNLNFSNNNYISITIRMTVDGNVKLNKYYFIKINHILLLFPCLLNRLEYIYLYIS